MHCCHLTAAAQSFFSDNEFGSFSIFNFYSIDILIEFNFGELRQIPGRTLCYPNNVILMFPSGAPLFSTSNISVDQ